MDQRIYKTSPGQYSAGEAIGILLLESPVPFIPGDVANASTYRFPVRFQPVKGYSVARAVSGDASVYRDLLEAALALKAQGVRAITGDCGYMALHQTRLAQELNLPVFLSSLLQLPFIRSIIKPGAKVGILVASGAGITSRILAGAGIEMTPDLIFAGMDAKPAFKSFGIDETGELDAAAVEQEVVETGLELLAKNPDIGAFLLECSLLPPYSAALQQATGLPVFDYVTMINYVFSAVIQIRYSGFV